MKHSGSFLSPKFRLAGTYPVPRGHLLSHWLSDFLLTMMFSTPRNACPYSFERSAALMEYGPCKACRGSRLACREHIRLSGNILVSKGYWEYGPIVGSRHLFSNHL